MSAIGVYDSSKSTVMGYESCTSERLSGIYLAIEIAWHDWMEVILIERVGDRLILPIGPAHLDFRREDEVRKRLINCPVPIRNTE
jgi:hypothetical protein